jgi:uncharacterized protein (TIGR00251 family)
VARIAVRVTPRAGRDAIDGYADDRLRVRVAAAPADGAANEAVVRLLARTLGVAPARIRLLTGAASRAKIFEVDGMDDASVLAAIRSALPDPPG